MIRDKISYEEQRANIINEMHNSPYGEYNGETLSPLLKLLIIVIFSSGGTSCVDSQ